MTDIIDIGLVDLATNNQDLRHKIEIMLSTIDETSLTIIEDQVSDLMTNMLNFFAKNIEEIPAFDSLTPEQQQFVLLKFKKVARSLKTRKIKTMDEMLQTFVFTILNNINEKVAQLSAAEIIYNKSKQGFREFLRKTANDEIYRITNSEQTVSTKEYAHDFIHNAVLLGVHEAMQKIGLKFGNDDLHKESFIILEEAHKSLQKSVARQI